MAELHAIAALVRKRAELATEITETSRKRHGLTLQLAQVDCTLLIMGYGKDPNAIKPRRKVVPPLFKQAQLRRLLYDIRRVRPEMTDNQQIADEVMRKLGWDSEDAALRFSVFLKVREKMKTL